MFQKIQKVLKSKIFLLSFSGILSTSMIAGAFVYKTGAATMCPDSRSFYCIGGKITEIEVCCNGLKVTVEGDYGGDFMYTPPLSDLNLWFNLTEEKCVKGDAYQYGVCVKPASWPPCSDEEDVDGTIRQIGTTLEDPESGHCENVSSSSGGSWGGGGGGGGGGGAGGGF
jgi:hypothetical protein